MASIHQRVQAIKDWVKWIKSRKAKSKAYNKFRHTSNSNNYGK